MADRGLAALYAHLTDVGPISIDGRHRGFVLQEVGSESFIFRRPRNRHAGEVVKFALVDYTEPADVDRVALERHRQQLRQEAELLQRLADSSLPDYVDLVVGENPLLPESSPGLLRRGEVFLVMEFIAGSKVSTLARTLHAGGRRCCADRLGLNFAIAVLELQKTIRRRLGNDCVYTDIKPENCILSASGLRILDAASISTVTRESSHHHVSLRYMEPIDIIAWGDDALRCDGGFVLRSVARAARMVSSNFAGEEGKHTPPMAASTPKPLVKAYAELSFQRRIGEIEEALELLRKLEPEISCGHDLPAASG